MPKKVLIFTYRYPPYGGIGAVRMTCVSKYLPDYGWKPYVYTSDWNPENCRLYDANFGTDVLEHVIHRATIVPATQAPVDENANSSSKLGKKINRYRQGFKELSNWRNWVREGKDVLQQIIEKHSGFDAIIASYPTTPALKLGDWTSRTFGIPWLADFRDILEESRSKLLWFKMWKEQRMVRSCSSMMTVSEPLAESLRKRYEQSAYSIPNGFDPNEVDYNSIERSQGPQSHFQILYTGQLYPPGHPAREGPGLLFDALDQLDSESKINLDDIEVKFIGMPKQKISPHLTGRKSEKCISILKWVPRDQIRRLQVDATLLFSLGSRHMKGILTGKIFEYLQSRRPILSIPADDDGIGSLLSSTNSGCATDTLQETAVYIFKCYQQWKPDRRLPDNPVSDEIQRYNWQNQTGRVAEILDRITK
jgi:hypothetical protein